MILLSAVLLKTRRWAAFIGKEEADPGSALQSGYITLCCISTFSEEASLQQEIVSVIRKGAQPVFPKPGSIVTVKVGIQAFP